MLSLRSTALLVALPWLLALTGGCDNESAEPADASSGTEDVVAQCERDDHSEPGLAAPLTLGSETLGFLCPVEDEDWYTFSTGANDHLFRVRLEMDQGLSPVEPTYTLFKNEGGQPGEVVATPPGELVGIGAPLNIVHCGPPGDYFVAVRDSGDDAQDFRRNYKLTVTTQADPDPNEPNDDQAGSGTIAPNVPIGGTIACRGDEDWYNISAQAGQLMQITLTAPTAGYEPTVRVVDSAGNLVATDTNLKGSIEETDISRLVVLTTTDTFYVIVGDDDGQHANPEVQYSLTVTVASSTDPNEPNNDADTSTPLTGNPVTCEYPWTDYFTATGNIGAPGDTDWFRIPISGCGKGILEAEVAMDTAGKSAQQQWETQAQVQMTVALIRPHGDSACSDDEQCTTLDLPCGSDLDCAGVGNICSPQEGLCLGATACLQEGICGATEIQRNYQVATIPGQISAPPPPNEAKIAAPLLGGSAVYIRVSDFQSNGADPNANYTLRVRIRNDPDVNEPSNVYTNQLIGGLPAKAHQELATGIPIHDCTDPVNDCCNDGTWISGNIGYENDLDWFRYQHPCPGENCMVRILYESDPGPVDMLMAVYRGSSLWFDGMIPVSEQESNSSKKGAYGGLGASDECFYAYQAHQGEPFFYYVLMRDLADVRDWDSDQEYRFCVEKIGLGCLEPCVEYEDNVCNTQ